MCKFEIKNDEKTITAYVNSFNVIRLREEEPDNLPAG